MVCVCVACGAVVEDREGRRVAQAFDQRLLANTGILKLLECRRCGQVCDQYLEVCGTLVLLDLALQSLPALRHVLLNSGHGGTVLRVALVTAIVDGYCRWSSSHPGGRFFERELHFYLCCGEAAAGAGVFLGVTLATLGARSALFPTTTSPTTSTTSPCSSTSTLPCPPSTLVLGLLLAYCTLFLRVVPLLWASPDTPYLWPAVHLLFLLTTVSVLRVLSTLPTPSCWALALTSHLAMHLHRALAPSIAPLLTSPHPPLL